MSADQNNELISGTRNSQQLFGSIVMSNIFTSYLRIFPRSKEFLTEPEINRLFTEIVQAYGEFGSYWVRIEKRFYPSENYLDIIYGSSKRTHTDDYILERIETIEKYDVWERLADEGGGPDKIGRWQYDPAHGWVECKRQDCRYAFDKIRAIGRLPNDFLPFAAPLKSNGVTEFSVCGSYFGCNSRSFVDLVENSEFYGANLGYDPAYKSAHLIPDTEGPLELSIPTVRRVIERDWSVSTDDCLFELEWQGQLVKRISAERNQYGERKFESGDGWENTINREYLSFVGQYQLGKER